MTLSLYEQLTEPFPENEVEWRIGRSGKNDRGVWASCMAYITSRAIQERLDQVIGPLNWEVSYRTIEGKDLTTGILATLSITAKDPSGSLTIVDKEDGAEQTDIESFKGGLSSAFKRAAVTWGIGRYLYGLEEGKAKVVSQSTLGARYGKTKEGDVFFWLPPELPDWAKPKDIKIQNEDLHQFRPSPEPQAKVVDPEPVQTQWHPGNEQKEFMKKLCSSRLLPLASMVEYMNFKFGVKELAKLSEGDYKTLVHTVQSKDAKQILDEMKDGVK